MIDVIEKIEHALAEGNHPRIHGNGFLQLDLDNKTKRFHVFDPLLPCRQTRPTTIHDHTQGFTSHVLFGQMVNVCHKLVQGKKYRIWTGYKTGTNYRLGATNEVIATKEIDRLIVPAGFSYDMAPFVFHETIPQGLTITIIHKWEQQSGVERVLCPIEYEPDNTFDRLGYPDIAFKCLEDAMKKLTRS